MAGITSFLAQAPALPISPVVILVLCVISGVGTVFLLPGHPEASIRRIGGAVLIACGLIFLAVLVRAVGTGWGIAEEAYFWIFSAIALEGAVRVVSHPRPVYSALYFVLTVFASAGLFVLMEAEFMAAALVFIYAGAILITYVFVIMLASQATAETATTPAQQLSECDNHSREPLAAAAIGFALMGVFLFLIFDRAAEVIPTPGPSMPLAQPIRGATQQLGMYLFHNQLVQVELAGLILTVAMVGAIVIARRQVLLSGKDVAAGPSQPEVVVGPATPIDDNPHSIPVYGTKNPRQKAYPET